MRTLLVVALATPCAAQATWIVDALNGPGTHFTALQSAVDAAANGDVIRLRGAGIPPNGVSYAAATIDSKGLSIVGDGPATTCVTGLFTVTNVSGVQRVRIGGFKFGDWQSVQPPAVAPYADFDCRSNAGLVLIEDIVSHGHNDAIDDFTDCAQVVLRSVNSTQLNGFRAIRSNITIESCRFTPEVPWIRQQKDSLRLQNSRAWIVNSYLEGHSGLSQFDNIGGPAIGSVDSEIFLGPGTTLVGGRWFSTGHRNPISDGWQFNDSGCGLPCGFSIPPSCVHRDPSVQFVGTYPPTGYLADDLRPVTTVRASVANTTLTIDHRGTPASATFLGAGPLLPAPWPSIEGMLSIDPAQTFLWFAMSGGSLQWNFAIPQGLPAGFMLGLQGVELRPNGTLGITNLTTFANW